MADQSSEKDALVRVLARHVLTHLAPEYCTADCMADAILAAGWTRATRPQPDSQPHEEYISRRPGDVCGCTDCAPRPATPPASGGER